MLSRVLIFPNYGIKFRTEKIRLINILILTINNVNNFYTVHTIYLTKVTSSQTYFCHFLKMPGE